MATLAEAAKVLKGDIQVSVIAQSAPSAGKTKKGDDYVRKNFTIRDDSAEMEITCWGADINKLIVGKKYDIISPYFKMYNGQVQVQLSQYSKVSDPLGPAETTPPPGQTQMPPAQTEVDYNLPGEKVNEMIKAVHDIHTAEKIVSTELTKMTNTTPDPAKVGMYVKLILEKVKI